MITLLLSVTTLILIVWIDSVIYQLGYIESIRRVLGMEVAGEGLILLLQWGASITAAVVIDMRRRHARITSREGVQRTRE